MYKIIICGSREFTDYSFLSLCLNDLREHWPNEIEIVCGMCRGADKLGEQWALKNGYPVKRFYADWNGQRNSAGVIRNEKMADYSEGGACVAFWDGKVKGSGTYDMTKRAKAHNLNLKIIYV